MKTGFKKIQSVNNVMYMLSVIPTPAASTLRRYTAVLMKDRVLLLKLSP